MYCTVAHCRLVQYSMNSGEDSCACNLLLDSRDSACLPTLPVRPEFTDTLAVQQGRHPILSKIMNDPVVPNNAVSSPPCCVLLMYSCVCMYLTHRMFC